MSEYYDYENKCWLKFPEPPFKVRCTNRYGVDLKFGNIYYVNRIIDEEDGNQALFILDGSDEEFFAFRFEPYMEEAQPEQDEGWIPWSGGDCPVTDDHTVDLMFRDGTIKRDAVPSEYYWTHVGAGYDFVKYRLTKAPTEQVKILSDGGRYWGCSGTYKAPIEPSKAVTEETATMVATPVIKHAVEAPMGFEVNSNGGVKETGGKLRWTLLPIIALKEVVKVLEYGAKKYAPDNWQKVEKEKYKEALWRHWVAYNEGEKIDPETGLHHLAHLVCDALFILWFEVTGKKDV